MLHSLKSIFCGWSLLVALVQAAEHPNILWITSEDNAASWVGCYGFHGAKTPRINRLADEGFRFTRAYANAPVCAVARSTILNGVHAVTQGTHHMRSRYPIPDRITPYVTAMRAMGYYCTNHTKTDYNFRGNDGKLWDDSTNKAHYRNRPQDKPFLAVVNLYVSHESSLFPDMIAANRKRGAIPQTTRLDPALIALPPYLPDLPEIRSDMAIYHDTMNALDREVGDVLDQLEKDGLAEDTIVFYYSDHGGILPRGKRYLEDSGTRVPLIIRVPEKWRHLAPFVPGKAVDELVSFVDFAPTLLSLAGASAVPTSMQGRPFLGKLRRDAPADDMVYLSADRFDEIPGMRRAITDGRWKYIRCFTPQQPGAPYSMYPLGQSGWAAWQKAWKSGGLDPKFRGLWDAPQPAERLYHQDSDPSEVRDLSQDPAHAEQLKTMRARLRSEMIRHCDAGLIPEAMYGPLVRAKPIADQMVAREELIPELVDLALLSGVACEADLPKLRERMKSADPLVRYWAAHAVASSPGIATSLLSEMKALVGDSEAAIRLIAAGVLYDKGEKETMKHQFRKELESSDSEGLMLAILTELKRIDALDIIPDSWIEGVLSKGGGEDPYPKRLAERLRKERKGEGEEKGK